MNRLIPLIALLVTLMPVSPALQAQESTSAAEQLKQYVAEFQRSPANGPLREKIIRLVATMNPKPEIPEEARRHGVKALTLEKDAKKPSDYEMVVAEYAAAESFAPWWPEAMASRAKADEARGQYQSAINGYKWFLYTRPAQDDARTAQDKIYALEAKLEKAEKDKKEQQKREQEAKGEQQRREREIAKQRQEEEAKQAKAQDLAGTWLDKGGDVAIVISKSGSNYSGSIPNDDGKWRQSNPNIPQTLTRSTLKKFWISGTTVHFVVSTEAKDKNAGVYPSPWIWTGNVTLSNDGSTLVGTNDTSVNGQSGEEKPLTLYRRN